MMTAADLVTLRLLVGDSSECWGWLTGHPHADGYWRTAPPSDMDETLIHRIVYRVVIGPIPDGHGLHHRCENTACTNPGHMRPLTQGRHALVHPQNPAGRHARQTHCIHGHPFSGLNLIINSRGQRVCRICRDRRNATSQERARAH